MSQKKKRLKKDSASKVCSVLSGGFPRERASNDFAVTHLL